MRPEPPSDLIELLGRLKLATPDDVGSVYPRVRSFAGDLPLFSTVWVDALRLAEILTPYQAMEINVGHGARIRVGPYVLEAPLSSLGFAAYYYRARHIESRRAVHLLLAPSQPTAADAASQIMSVAARLKTVRDRQISKPIEAGTYGENIWIAFASEDATPLGDVLLNLGRLDGNSVLEIARQLVGFLGELEAVEVYHGDISTLSVCLLDDGSIRLRYPGVSGILRPVVDALEDASHGDTNAARRSRVASDIYACGALWWQLLSGRLPLPAAASIGSLDGIAKKKLVDVRRYAPDAPAALVTAIDACLGGNSGQPAASLTALAKMLGPPSPTGRRVLKAVIAQLKCHSSASIATIARRVIRSKESAAWMATIAGCLAVIAGVSWPLWRSQSPPQPATEKTPAVASATKTTTSNAAGRAAAKPNQKLHADVQQAAFIGRPVDAEPLVLPNTMVEWNNVQRALRPGQLVRGAPGKRPSIVIPASGIVLAVEDIRFQGIDFIWRPAADAAFDPERLELFELCAAQATFRDCTLTAVADSTSGHPVAIRWTGPRQQRQLSPAGRLQIDGCLMRGVVAAIDCRCHSPLSISVSETLYLGPGPLVRMDRVPKIDEPLEVQLSRLTLRGAAAVVGIHIEQMPEDEPGSIVIVAHNCAFSPARGGSLVLFASAEFPGRLARSIQWSGEGSVLSAESPAAFWLPRGKNAIGREMEVRVEGIVASRLEFAGPAKAGWSESRLARWQGATQSDEPPGISERPLNAISPIETSASSGK